MITLHEMREQAKNSPEKRKFLIICESGKSLNGKFIDPWLGLVELDCAPGVGVYTKSLGEHETTGIFID